MERIKRLKIVNDLGLHGRAAKGAVAPTAAPGEVRAGVEAVDNTELFAAPTVGPVGALFAAQ